MGTRIAEDQWRVDLYNELEAFKSQIGRIGVGDEGGGGDSAGRAAGRPPGHSEEGDADVDVARLALADDWDAYAAQIEADGEAYDEETAALDAELDAEMAEIRKQLAGAASLRSELEAQRAALTAELAAFRVEAAEGLTQQVEEGQVRLALMQQQQQQGEEAAAGGGGGARDREIGRASCRERVSSPV